MRRLTRCIPVSTDGFIATGDDELGDWFTWDEEMQAFVNGIFRSIDTIVCGRVLRNHSPLLGCHRRR